MIISLIAALGRNRVIGKNNALPWNLPKDTQYFLDKVRDKTVIMGRNTFESVGSKPLSKKKNIILTEDLIFKVPESCVVAHSIDQALKMVDGEEEVMVCGGALVYKQFLPLADKLYLTYIHHSFDGDTYFPEVNMAEWRETSREDHQPDEKNVYPYSFVVLERKQLK